MAGRISGLFGSLRLTRSRIVPRHGATHALERVWPDMSCRPMGPNRDLHAGRGMSLATKGAATEVVVAAFPTEDGAKEAMRELDDAKRRGIFGIQSAVVLRRDARKRVHVSESASKGFGPGAIVGGAAGAAVGLAAGPIAWATLGGAAAGGMAWRLRRGPRAHEEVRQAKTSLPPGSSALVTVVEHGWVAAVERSLKESGAALHDDAAQLDVSVQ